MERELVQAAQRGDRDAFDALAVIHVDRLFALARLILRDADAAEDATQEALVRAWRDLPRLREPERFGDWQRQAGRARPRAGPGAERDPGWVSRLGCAAGDPGWYRLWDDVQEGFELIADHDGCPARSAIVAGSRGLDPGR